MTPEDVIRGFREGVEHTSEEKEYANTLFQEAIKIGMEINQTYHTLEELLKLMGKLTGKAVDSCMDWLECPVQFHPSRPSHIFPDNSSVKSYIPTSISRYL